MRYSKCYGYVTVIDLILVQLKGKIKNIKIEVIIKMFITYLLYMYL